MSEGCHYADRRFIPRLLPVECVYGRAYEWVDRLVVFEYAHQSAESNRAEEVCQRVCCGEQIDHLAVFQSG